MIKAISVGPIHVNDSVSAHAVDSLAFNMKREMQISKGYFYDLKDVSTEDVSPEQMPDFPFINMAGYGVEYRNPEKGNNSSEILEKYYRVQLDIWAHLSGNINLGRERLLTDVEKFVFTPANRGIPDKLHPEKIHWARAILIEKAMPFGSKVTRPNCGYEIHLLLCLGQRMRQPNVNA